MVGAVASRRRPASTSLVRGATDYAGRMGIALVDMDPSGMDRRDLAAFFARNRFPFDAVPATTAEKALARIDRGDFDQNGVTSLWIVDDAGTRLGMVELCALGERSPWFEMRLDGRYRGHGLGPEILREITRRVFTTHPEAVRVEGRTREDNIAMRQTFVRCGFVKEAHFREAWPVEGGAPRAGVVYSILRRDWESGAMTPVRFEDLGY